MVAIWQEYSPELAMPDNFDFEGLKIEILTSIEATLEKYPPATVEALAVKQCVTETFTFEEWLEKHPDLKLADELFDEFGMYEIF
jgi:hypothetical protein